MRSKKDIKRLFGKFNVRGDARMDERITDDMLDVMRKSKPVKPVDWRAIVKKTMMPAAIAAIIMIAAIFAIGKMESKDAGSPGMAGRDGIKTEKPESIDVTNKDGSKDPGTTAVVSASAPEHNMDPMFKLLLDPKSDFSDKVFWSSLGKDIPTPSAAPELSNEFVGRLKSALLSEHVEVRRRAAVALNYFADKSGVEVMIADISSKDAQVRAGAAKALRTLADKKAAKVLIAATKDEVAAIRCTALLALGEMKVKGITELLIGHLTDKKGGPKSIPAIAACKALASLGDRKAIPKLIETLDDKVLNDAACKALKRLKDGDMRRSGKQAGIAGDGEFIGQSIRSKGFWGGSRLEVDLWNCKKQAWEKWWDWENLNGKAVQVRWYKNYKADPAAYKIVDLKLKKYSLNFDSIDANSLGVIVILGEDQENEVICDCVGGKVYIWAYKKGLTFKLDKKGKSSAGASWAFYDASNSGGGISRTYVGSPLKGKATVETFICVYKGPKVKIGQAVVDSVLPALIEGNRDTWFEFTVTHPDYGIAKARVRRYQGSSMITLPLLGPDSKAADRRIWGYVVDEDGKAVAGADIECGSVRTLGQGLINPKSGRYMPFTVVTDAKGYFRMYMPVSDQNKEDRGKLIPPGSKYQLNVRAPEGMALKEMKTTAKNGVESTIVMKRLDITELVEDINNVTDGKFRKLVFVGENGVITDAETLKKTEVTIHRENLPRIVLKYEDFKDGTLLPDGRYEALMLDQWSRPKLKFISLQVGPKSKDELTFTLPMVTFSGQILHGITKKPMAGVFVMTGRFGNLSSVTSEQWEKLHKFGENPWGDDPAFLLLSKMFGKSRIIRTDENGRYKLVFPKKDNFYEFSYFDENFIGLKQRMYNPKEGLHGKVPTKFLFPAAKVFIQTKVDGRPAICPKWVISRKDNPEWVKDLLALDNRRDKFFTYDGWIEKGNVRQSISVPAGVDMKLRLRTPYEDTLCDYTYPETFKLAQGQVLDLGECTFAPTIKVFLKVVDSSGTGVEGVPVRVPGSVAHNTDSKGLVQFYRPPGTKGKFTVYSRQSDNGYKTLSESADYNVAGPEDEGSEYILKLSDEILKYLFKKPDDVK
ncbi:MAG: hypothetical protein FVQ82_14585 [Planctomycetes bacterium]|nr:hypothetical protein [Planctomycetota bacterium]